MGGHEMTIDELKQALYEAAGADESINLDGDILDVEFADLGYDSVALLETSGQVERKYGVVLADEAVSSAPTPRAFLGMVNSCLQGNRVP